MNLRFTSFIFKVVLGISFWGLELTVAFAIPAVQKPIQVRLPDGTTLTVYLHGDENLSWITTPDGYLIDRNERGFFEYVLEVRGDRSELSGVRVYDEHLRVGEENRFLETLTKGLRPYPLPKDSERSSEMQFSPKGTYNSVGFKRMNQIGLADRQHFKGILVPVHFQDVKLTYSQGAIDSLMNVRGYDRNGAKGSVRDYFHDMSRGRFDFQMEVLPPYTAKRNRDSYGKNGEDLKTEVFTYIEEMMGERWREFDVFPDGRIDHVSIIFAGYGQESTSEENVIWSNNSQSTWNGYNYAYTNVSLIAELDNRDGVQGMETYCHEFGHALGLPDFYCVSNCNDVGLFPDQHELMSANTFSGYPVPMSSFSTYILGWTAFKTIDAKTPGDYIVPDMLAGSTAFRYYTATPGEFFVIENRSSANRWQDRDDLGRGMLVFRVDSVAYNENLNDNEVNSYENYGYQLIRADSDPYYYSVEGDYFGGEYDAFTDETTPASLSKSGEKTHLPLTGIRRKGDSLSFRFVSATSAESQILALTGRVEPAQENGKYRSEARYIIPLGMECTESGICYGVIPRPTVQGSKVINESGSDIFETELDLSSFVYGAKINIRAYAMDGEGNVYYGGTRTVSIDRHGKMVVDSFYAATIDNGGLKINKETLCHAELLELDLSAMESPVLEGPKGGWSNNLGLGYILVSTDSGDSWITIEPSGTSRASNRDRLKFALPGSFPSCRIKYVCDFTLGSQDTVFVREGTAYNDVETEAPLFYLPESDFGNYVESSYDELQEILYEIYSFDISDMENPSLRIRNSYNSSLDILAVRTDTTFFERWYSKENCGSKEIAYRDHLLLPSVSYRLPDADRVYLVVTGRFAELEVYDMGRTGARIHQIRSADPTTVEVTFSRNIDYENPLEGYVGETGICWSTEDEPSLENSLVLPFRSYSVLPVTGLPEQDVYFWTYLKKGGEVVYSHPSFKSTYSDGQRDYPLLTDTVNVVTPVAFSEGGAHLITRVDFPASHLEGAVAQGICYDNIDDSYITTATPPDLQSNVQYFEGELQKTVYFPLVGGNRVRTFCIDSSGGIRYSHYEKAKLYIPVACPMENPELLGMVYTMPVNIMSEVSKKYDGYATTWEGQRIEYTGASYWRKKDIEMHIESYGITFSGVGGYVISPLIVNTGITNPVMTVVLPSLSGSGYRFPIDAKMYLIDAHSMESHFLTSISYGQTYEIPLGAYGDSIFLKIDISPYSNNSFQISSWRIDEKLTPTVRTGDAVAEGDSLFFSAEIVAEDVIPPATAQGFIYSPYGDPLIAIGQQAFGYYRISVDSLENGLFSASVYQPWFSFNYVRAYAENENGVAYGQCHTVVQCRTYPLQAYSLPVTDDFKAEVYSQEGSVFRQAVLCNECDKDAEYIVEYSGSLQLQQPPALNKIHAHFGFYIQVDYEESAIGDPENQIKPYVEITYKRTSSEEYHELPEGSVFRFDKTERLPGVGTSGGWNVYFVVEADFPRDFSHFRVKFRKNKDWEIYNRKIEYTESEDVDNFIATPHLEYLNVENDRLAVNWSVDQTENMKAVRIYRETNQLDVWELVHEYPAPVTAGSYSFVDEDSRPQTRSYRYVVKSVNSDDDEFASAIHKSIHLSINKGIQNQWNLIWNTYEGKPVSTIQIYRGTSSSDLVLMDEVNGGNTSFTDIEAPEGDVYYQVTYLLAGEGVASSKAVYYSRSNIATNVEEEPDPEPEFCTVRILDCVGGEISASIDGIELPKEFSVEEGALIRLKAEPFQGYEFASWWDGSMYAIRSWTVKASTDISATFRKELSQGEDEALVAEIWPNPVSDQLHIRLPEVSENLVLRDIRGRVVFRQDIFVEMDIPMGGLPSGIYILEYEMRGEILRYKVMKR